MMRRFASIAVVLGAAIPMCAVAQTRTRAGDTVTVTQRVLVAGDVTPADAKRQALEKALAEAVRRVAGVRVQASQLGVDEDRGGRTRDSFLSVVQLDASGRATDYRVLGDRFVTEQHAALGAQVYYEVRALVTVAAETGVVDPGFTLTVSLNDALFFDSGGSVEGNDELVATIAPSRDAWLTVFDVTGDSAQLLLPNAIMADARALGGKAFELPSRDWRDRGVHFRASLSAGETARRELLMVVATRTQVAFPATPPAADGAASPSVSLMAIQRWLVTIPLDQRAVAFAAYEVRRKQ